MKQLLMMALVVGLFLVPLPILPQPIFKSVSILKSDIEASFEVSVVRDYDESKNEFFDYFIRAIFKSSKFNDFSDCFETSGVLLSTLNGQQFSSTSPKRELSFKDNYIVIFISERKIPLSDVVMSGELKFSSTCNLQNSSFEFNETFTSINKRHTILSLFLDMINSA